jgi:Ca2+ transporting ATPase
MQIFNQLNARKLDGEINIFSGIFRNPLFIYIVLFTVAMQIILVEFVGAAVKCWPLNLN